MLSIQLLFTAICDIIASINIIEAKEVYYRMTTSPKYRYKNRTSDSCMQWIPVTITSLTRSSVHLVVVYPRTAMFLEW